MPSQRTRLAGKSYFFQSLDELREKVRLSKEKAKLLAKSKLEPIEKLVVNNDGDVLRIDVKKHPLLLRKFGAINIKDRNEKLLSDNVNLTRNIKIYDAIPENKVVKITIKIDVEFDISQERGVRRQIIRVFDGSSRKNKIRPDEIEEKIINIIDNYYRGIKQDVSNKKYSYTILSNYRNQELVLDDLKLRDHKPLRLFNQVINVDDNINDKGNCFKEWAKTKLTRLSKKVIDALGNENGVTPNEVYNLCVKYGIELRIFDINGIIYKSYKPEIRSRNYPALLFLTYNNHCYPLKNISALKFSKEPDNLSIAITDNIMKDCEQILEMGDLPGNVKINGENIISFVHEDVKFIQNDQYLKCKEILTKFGLEEYIFDNIKLNHLFCIIEKLYIKENINSWFPKSDLFIKQAYNYKTNNIIDKNREISTIDKNKAYSHCLMNLPYLIHFDYRTSKITKNPTEIINHYLYIVKPDESSILLPHTDIYPGYHINMCKEQGLTFKVLEGMSTSKSQNYYSEMIKNIYKNIDNDDAKEIVNIGIGKMEVTESVSDKFVVKGIFNKEEVKCHSGYDIEINEDYTLLYDSEVKTMNLYNKKPIAIQVKDMGRVIVYEKMKQLKLKSEDIIQIKTDAITYYGKLPKGLNTNKIESWKEIKYTEFQDLEIPEQKDLTFNVILDEYVNKDNGTLAYCMAGCGKTTDIINNLLPKLKEDNKKYIVLTPSHISLKEFRENKEKCNVIQYYTMNNKIPEEDVIVIDEFGMCDKHGHDLIYKCSMLGKEYYCYGDFRQLPPVEKNNTNIISYDYCEEEDQNNKYYASDQYLDMMFKNKKIMDKNYRNTFSKDYYESIINETIDIKEEVKKHSTKKYSDAEVIICWRNDTVDKYNNLVLKSMKKTMYDIGIKLICITNNLHQKNMYNKFVETIIKVDIDNDEYTLSNNVKLTKKEITKNFKPAYARTVYGVQSQSLDSYYYAKEDYGYLDGNRAYTVISRLKTKNIT